MLFASATPIEAYVVVGIFTDVGAATKTAIVTASALFEKKKAARRFEHVAVDIAHVVRHINPEFEPGVTWTKHYVCGVHRWRLFMCLPLALRQCRLDHL